MKNKKRIIWAKLLRALGITKPIKLDKYEIDWIKLCKGHYKDKYQTNASNWIDTLKPMFTEVYGWSPEEHYNDFLDCMFNRLLELHLKIQHDKSGHHAKLKEIFSASFSKSIRRDYDLPKERAIAELCGQIQCNLVVENGVPRYYL